MGIRLSSLRKVRCRVQDETNGQPVAGIVVNLSIGDGEDDAPHIPVATLISDSTGYLAFDLQPLIECGFDDVPRLSINAPQVGVKDRDLFDILRVSSNSDVALHVANVRPPANDPTNEIGLPLEFPILVDPHAVDTNGKGDCSSLRLASVQKPDRLDYEFSPFSFVTPVRINVGGDCCETLAPSTLPVQEHTFYRVVVRRDRAHEIEGFKRGVSRPVELDRQLPEPEPIIKFAEVLEYRQRWHAIGHSLGEIRYSLPLAPGESTQLAVIDWSRNDAAGRFDSVQGTEFLEHELNRDRSIEESIEAGLHERQGGWSWAGGLSSAMTYDTYAYGKYSGDWAAGGSTSNTTGDRNLDGDSLQDLHDTVIQGTSYVRSLNSTVIVQATQAESNVLQTRRVANHNHCHALTIEYYEVLRHFRLRTQFMQRRYAVLIPFAVVAFTRDLALRFRTIIERALLDDKLSECFDALVRLTLGPSAYDDPAKPTSGTDDKQEDDTGYFFGARPQFIVDASIAGGITDTNLNIKAGSMLTLTASSPTGIKFGNEATAKTFGPEGSDVYGLGPEPNMHAAALLADIGGDRYEVGLGATVTAKHDGHLRFLFNDPSWQDNHGLAVVDIVVKKQAVPTTTVTDPNVPSPGATAGTERGDKICEQRLLTHLNGNLGYYNRAIWFLMDPSERRLYIEAALGRHNAVLDAVDDTPIAVSGGHVAFLFNEPVPELAGRGDDAEPDPLESIVTLPTRGLFAEAQMGHCNSCEKVDATRMSDWTEMTVEEPPAISGVEPGPQGQMPTLTPAQLPSNVVQIVTPPTEPDPTGLAKALDVLKTPSIFKDMSGLDAASALLGKLVDGTIKSQQDVAKTAADAKDKVDAARNGSGTANNDGNAPSAAEKAKTLSLLGDLQKEFNVDPDLIRDLAVNTVQGTKPTPTPTKRTPTAKAGEVLIQVQVVDPWDHFIDANTECLLKDDTAGNIGPLRGQFRISPSATSEEGWLPAAGGLKKGVLNLRVQMLSVSYEALSSLLVDVQALDVPYDFPTGTNFARFTARQKYDEVTVTVNTGETLGDKATTALSGTAGVGAEAAIVELSLEGTYGKNWETEMTRTQTTTREYKLKVPSDALEVKQVSPHP